MDLFFRELIFLFDIQLCQENIIQREDIISRGFQSWATIEGGFLKVYKYKLQFQ